MKSWMGTETREGLERVTSYPLIPSSLYALVFAATLTPAPTSSCTDVSGLHGNHCPGTCFPSIPLPHSPPSPQIKPKQTLARWKGRLSENLFLSNTRARMCTHSLPGPTNSLTSSDRLSEAGEGSANASSHPGQAA